MCCILDVTKNLDEKSSMAQLCDKSHCRNQVLLVTFLKILVKYVKFSIYRGNLLTCCLRRRYGMKYRRTIFEIFFGIFLLMFTSTLLWSGEPGDIVKKLILKDISLRDGEETKERKQKIWGEISPSFDFEEMAKGAMDKYWRKRSPEEKREFIELFANNIKGSYMRKIGSRFGEKIISLSEEQDNGYTRVHVSLIKRTVEKVSADFRLIRKDEEWRICDVIFEGVSLVNNYRSQIYSFLVKSSYEDLVQTFKQKQVE